MKQFTPKNTASKKISQYAFPTASLLKHHATCAPFSLGFFRVAVEFPKHLVTEDLPGFVDLPQPWTGNITSYPSANCSGPLH